MCHFQFNYDTHLFHSLFTLNTVTLETTWERCWIPDLLPAGKQPVVSNVHTGLYKCEK